MKACTKCGIERSFGEFSKASREKDGLQHQCKQCNKKVSALYRAANPEKEKLRHKLYQQNNLEKEAEKQRRWRAQNPDKVKEFSKRGYLKNKEYENERNKKYHQENKDKIAIVKKQWRLENLEHRKQYDDMYWRNNKDYVYSKNAKRRARLLQALVPWADFEKIRAIYAECIKISKETGIAHHVDHIIPLQSKYICGLHVETNLQILPWYENLTKLNKFEFS